MENAIIIDKTAYKIRYANTGTESYLRRDTESNYTIIVSSPEDSSNPERLFWTAAIFIGGILWQGGRNIKNYLTDTEVYASWDPADGTLTGCIRR